MNIRDLSLLERLPASLDELISACKPGGIGSTRCPHLSAGTTRKAMALKGAIGKLRQALDAAGPPPRFAKEKPPLYLRINDHPEIREIARLVGHYGIHEDDLYALTKELAGTYGNERVSEAMVELTWVDRDTRWARLRPEVIRSCRPMIGPPPDAPDVERWWADRGGPPKMRSPGDPRPPAPKPDVTDHPAEDTPATAKKRPRKEKKKA